MNLFPTSYARYSKTKRRKIMISTFSSYFNDRPSTLSFYFAMNFLWISIGILTISFHVQKISAKQHNAIRYAYNGPLAVLEIEKILKAKETPAVERTLEVDGTPETDETPEVEGTPKVEGTQEVKETPEVRILTLKIAKPRGIRRSDSEDIARSDFVAYFDNDNPDIGPISTFKTACPSYTEDQKKIETKWRDEVKDAKDSTLFFVVENTGLDMLCPMKPDELPVPSINKMGEKCANLQGEKYEVGYTVYLEDGDFSDYHFMAMYEICHSTVEEITGTIYTSHIIKSPELLLLEVHEWYSPKKRRSFQSPFDPSLNEFYALNDDLPIYQLVPRYDMPTLLWENTTLLPFNYTSISSFKIFKRMMVFDNVIRLFSQRTGKKLRIFTGTHQTTITETSTWRRHKTKVHIHSVWKVIFDNAGYATILVTQYTRKKCGIAPYICDTRDKNFIELEHYKLGGCIYKCSVTHELLKSLHLHLPEWEINGNLDISYPKELPAGAEPHADAQSSSSSVSISDFADGAAFVPVFLAVDGGLAQAMIDAGIMDSNDGNGAEGGHHDGNHDGDAGPGTADGMGE